jgi:hypothetical protein
VTGYPFQRVRDLAGHDIGKHHTPAELWPIVLDSRIEHLDMTVLAERMGDAERVRMDSPRNLNSHVHVEFETALTDCLSFPARAKLNRSADFREHPRCLTGCPEYLITRDATIVFDVDGDGRSLVHRAYREDNYSTQYHGQRQLLFHRFLPQPQAASPAKRKRRERNGHSRTIFPGRPILRLSGSTHD